LNGGGGEETKVMHAVGWIPFGHNELEMFDMTVLIEEVADVLFHSTKLYLQRE
jgi:hypothetical protein